MPCAAMHLGRSHASFSRRLPSLPDAGIGGGRFQGPLIVLRHPRRRAIVSSAQLLLQDAAGLGESPIDVAGDDLGWSTAGRHQVDGRLAARRGQKRWPRCMMSRGHMSSRFRLLHVNSTSSSRDRPPLFAPSRGASVLPTVRVLVQGQRGWYSRILREGSSPARQPCPQKEPTWLMTTDSRLVQYLLADAVRLRATACAPRL